MANSNVERAKTAIAIELIKYRNKKRSASELKEILADPPYKIEITFLSKNLKGCNWFDITKEGNKYMVEIKPELYKNIQEKAPDLPHKIERMEYGIAYFNLERVLGEP